MSLAPLRSDSVACSLSQLFKVVGMQFPFRPVLEDARNQAAILPKMSELQANAIAAMVQDSSLNAQEMAAVSEAAAKLPWHSPADLARIIGGMEPAQVPKKRRVQQDFTSILSYFTEPQWSALLDPTNDADAKLSGILGHCVKLGLRNPTEPTAKLICSLWTVCSSDPMTLGKLTSIEKVRYSA